MVMFLFSYSPSDAASARVPGDLPVHLYQPYWLKHFFEPFKAYRESAPMKWKGVISPCVWDSALTFNSVRPCCRVFDFAECASCSHSHLKA